MLDKSIDLYKQLLIIYTEELQKVEVSFKNSHEKSTGNPIAIFNNRLLTYDEYLNPYYFEVKQKMMPLLIQFIASFELLSVTDKEDFAAFKDDKYSKSLHSVITNLIPFKDITEEQIKVTFRNQLDIKLPIQPKKRNATKKISDYRDAKQKYDEKIESNECIINELKTRLKYFEDCQEQLKNS